jgi:hypothetical protein
MNDFIQLDTSERALYCEQAEARTGLARQSIEKDFWVCWTLERLFSLPEWGPHFTFKGGTSLSKAWKLIQRFSEDIDLIVDKEILGFGGDAALDKAPSNKQRKAQVHKLFSSAGFSLFQIPLGTTPNIAPPSNLNLPVSTLNTCMSF